MEGWAGNWGMGGGLQKYNPKKIDFARIANFTRTSLTKSFFPEHVEGTTSRQNCKE